MLDKRTAADYLEETARRLPDKVAYVDPGRSVTFSEVTLEAKKLAQAIVDRGFFKSPVAVYLDKSIECIAAIFGVGFSGNFYTVLDTEMPKARVDKILDTLQPEIFLTDKAHLDAVKEFSGDKPVVLYEEAVEKEDVDEEALTKVREKIQSSDLMYVLFTSGSTGNPKGVAASHYMYVYYFINAQKVDQYEESDVLLNQTPFYFIMGGTDIFTPAFCGATTHIIPKSYYAFPPLLVNYIAEHKITFLMWVPSALAMIANTDAFGLADITCIKKIITGGEVVPVKVVRAWKKHLPDCYFVNAYGSTEMTDGGTYYVIDREFKDTDNLPIGIPYPNIDTMVIDENNKLVTEPYVEGELVIRSPSVAYGYYNDPERTKEVFVQNPLNPYYEEKVYKTGDLVQYNSYGEIEYTGRRDFQIKHRGQRIELGEIEINVSSVEGVEENACLYDKKRERIVLYYTGTIEEKQLRDQLKELLPPYMLPGKRVQLDKMPHNLNGKIDRTALRDRMEKK